MELHAEYPIRTICQVLGIHRSNVYYQPSVERIEYEMLLRDRIEAFAAQYPRYGYRKIRDLLRRDGHVVGLNHVERIMREENLQVQVKRYCKTTQSTKEASKYPNLIKGLEIDHVDQVWSGDITYIRLHHEFVYLAALMDLHTRAIRGWELSRSLDEQLTLSALGKALAIGVPEIHHSDQGGQYLSKLYRECLKEHGVSISLASRGCAWENAHIERWIRTLKEEEVYLNDYEDFRDAHQRIGSFIEDVYMQKRPHASLGYLTPAEFEERTMEGNSQ